MPLYEYLCRKCGQRFDLLRKMRDADRDLECPECQSDEIERLLSTFAAGGCTPSPSGRFT